MARCARLLKKPLDEKSNIVKITRASPAAETLPLLAAFTGLLDAGCCVGDQGAVGRARRLPGAPPPRGALPPLPGIFLEA